MQLIKSIKWALQKAKMRAYLRRKHGGNVHKATAAILALVSAPAIEAALYTF